MVLNIQNLDTSIPANVRVAPAAMPDVLPPRSGLSPTFHGSPPPKKEIQKETAQMRLAAYMVASGAKVRTIADQLEVSEATVYNWIRQPWFQANVTQIQQDEFGGDISAMLKTAATSAVLVTMDLMQNSIDDRVKLNAAKDILDRYRGKPTNFVHNLNHQISEDPQAEMKRLEETLRLTQQTQA